MDDPTTHHYSCTHSISHIDTFLIHGVSTVKIEEKDTIHTMKPRSKGITTCQTKIPTKASSTKERAI